MELQGIKPDSTPNNVFPQSKCAHVSDTCISNALRGPTLALRVGDGSRAASGTPNRQKRIRI